MIIKHKELGSLSQIADALWENMKLEVERNGHSDLTLVLEGSAYGIREIVELNNIVEENVFEKKNECDHRKVFSDYMLASHPPQYPWICAECGMQGVDHGTLEKDDFESIKKKFQ